MAKRLSTDPEVRAALIAARWAQRLGLPPGNLWEPGIKRYFLAELQRLGSDANAFAFLTAHITHQLGLTLDDLTRKGNESPV